MKVYLYLLNLKNVFLGHEISKIKGKEGDAEVTLILQIAKLKLTKRF